MSSRAALLSPISKEARALVLPWLASLAAMIQPAIADSPIFLGGLSVPAYFIAAAALGALSIGHEYTGRTLALLLSLPVHRTRVLAVKLGVLAAMLLLLWAVADTLVFGDARLPQSIRQTASWVPVFGGLFLAPWLTMVCRSAIAGTVFTIGIEGTLYVIGELLGTRLYGGGDVMQAFRLAFVWYGTIGLCVVAGIGTWRMFLQLEAIEGSGQHVRLPHWLRRSAETDSSSLALTRRHPISSLVQKELHLQQLPLALAALFVVTWPVARWSTSGGAHPGYGPLLEACVFLYAGLLPMLIGASASAGERQIGTLEWQILQPINTWKQWGIKVAVVSGLVVVLAVGLPMMLLDAGLLRIPGSTTVIQPDRSMVFTLMLLTTGSLYVSSLCGSPLWALLMSIPMVMAVPALFQFAWGGVAVPTYRLARDWAMPLLQPDTIGPINDMRIMNGFTVLLFLGFIALTLRLAFTNHRSAERASVRIWRQLTILAVFTVGAIILHSTARGIIVANTMLQLPPQLRSR